MKLLRDKLDVKNKTRANLFNWRGQFTPEFVDYILESFAHPNDVIVDPFAGSGTVLLECARRDLTCYGFEINPAAYAMSKFFTFANVPQEIRLDIVSRLEEKILSLAPKFHNLPLFSEHRSFRDSYKNLLDFAKALFFKTDTPKEKILALNTLFIAESCKKDDLNLSIINSFNYLKKNLMTLPFTDKIIDAKLGDARLTHKSCPLKANIIFTSPPYINVFNYHQNYRAILEVLAWNVLRVAESEIGSNRKNRGNRFKTVVQYCLEMEQSLKSFWQGTNKDGLIILVIGRESNVRKVPFYDGEIVREIAERIGGFRDVNRFERVFINKFGISIKEDIIVLKKDTTAPSFSKAREIALKHLKSALALASQEVKQDIMDAVDCIKAIESSPLFTTKGVFLNA